MNEVELRKHLEECKRTGCSHMLLCVDRTDGPPEEFCVKVLPSEDINVVVDFYTKNKHLDTSIVEVYNMKMDLEAQLLSEANVFNL